MNDINLYEKIPQEQFPIRILLYNNNDYKFAQHWHEHTELHYIFKGQCKLKCGEEIFALSEGEMAIINGNELHRGMGGECDYICLIIPPAFFEQNHAIFKNTVKDEYITELIGKIYEKYISHGALDMLEIKGNMYFLIAHLIKNYSIKTLEDSSYSGYVNKLNRVNEAIKYIGNNYDKPITTKVLASRIHLSEGHFCQIFKDVTGKTAMQYINGIRVEKAHKMLIKTDMTVTEIAFCCGFGDANYFSRLYKKIKGETPLSARQRKN